MKGKTTIRKVEPIIFEPELIPSKEELREKRNKELIEKYRKRVKRNRTPEERKKIIQQYRSLKNVNRT